ncbi:hypothetical protein JCM12107_11260 [Corynebacterium simulans]
MNSKAAMIATVQDKPLGGRFIGAAGREIPEANASSNQNRANISGIVFQLREAIHS